MSDMRLTFFSNCCVQQNHQFMHTVMKDLAKLGIKPEIVSNVSCTGENHHSIQGSGIKKQVINGKLQWPQGVKLSFNNENHWILSKNYSKSKLKSLVFIEKEDNNV